jgi:DNA-binding SARP family transcriptional activator
MRPRRDAPNADQRDTAYVAESAQYSLLGPVRAHHRGRELDPGPPQQSAVLALLLLAQGRLVTLEQLVWSMWGAAAPPAAAATVRTYLSRLRQLLPSEGRSSVIQTVRGGYLLAVEPGSLDLSVFTEQVRLGREARAFGDVGQAAAHLNAALTLWQGTALTGARGEYVTGESDRLERLRLTAAEERIALDIELGRHTEVLPELTSMVAAHPLEERLRELQMLALYRCARQADALQVYLDVRALLSQELGIEPATELRALHGRILRADPDLDRPAPAAAGVAKIEPPATAPVALPIAQDSAASQRPLLASRLHAARARGFVGRDAERTLFASALTATEPTFAAMFLHGPSGVGKSTLLRRLADDARTAGRTVVPVCGRVVQDSVAAFEHAADPALNDPDAVLMIDSFERCAPLEGWLHEQLLPQLADGTVVVLAGREPPRLAWREDPSWAGALLVHPLRELSMPEAGALLDARGVSAKVRDSVLAGVGGHPLALALAAEVARSGDSTAHSWQPGHDMIQTLLTELIGTAPSAAHQMALQVCAHASATSEQLLRTVMPDADTAGLFAWLRAQLFIKSGPAGLYPHDIVRDAMDADLRWRDPAAYEDIHRKIRHHVLNELVPRTAGQPAARATVQALRHLLRRGGVAADYLTAHDESDAVVDQYRPQDKPDLLRMTAATEGEESARIVSFWLDRQPSAFTVHRRRSTDRAVAFTSWLCLEEVGPDILSADPVVAAAWTHSRAHASRRPNAHIAITRHLIDPASYMRPSAVTDLCHLHTLRSQLDRCRSIHWEYKVFTNSNLWQPWMSYLNFTRLPVTHRIGWRNFALFSHDWQDEPIEVWRDRNIARELWGSDVPPNSLPDTPDAAPTSPRRHRLGNGAYKAPEY